MKKLLIGLLLNALIPMGSVAQNLSVIQATSRGWSGGAYGHSGCRYYMSLKANTKITMDSVYVGGIGYALIYNKKGYGNLTIDSVKHKYGISVSESHNYARNYNYDPDEDTKVKVVKKAPPPAPPVRHFEGRALVTYFYKGQKQFFIVKEMKALPAIAYP